MSTLGLAHGIAATKHAAFLVYLALALAGCSVAAEQSAGPEAGGPEATAGEPDAGADQGPAVPEGFPSARSMD